MTKNIELMIKIDEKYLKDIKECVNNGDIDYEPWVAIANGTPLPKGHGRMIILSEDVVKREQCAVSFSRQKWISEVGLSNATLAIIEADKAESEEYYVEVSEL